MFKPFHKSFCILILLPITLCCTKTDVENSGKTGQENVISNVPFVKQKYRFCGPAALTSVMKYYGLDADQDEIASEVYTPELKGSLISDMKHYAQELIDQKNPVIILADKGKLGINVQHYYVVYGYREGEKVFIIHDGSKSGREISYDKLDNEWKKMDRLMLVINYEE